MIVLRSGGYPVAAESGISRVGATCVVTYNINFIPVRRKYPHRIVLSTRSDADCDIDTRGGARSSNLYYALAIDTCPILTELCAPTISNKSSIRISD